MLPCPARTLSALTFLVEQDKKESQREGSGGGSGLFLFHPLVLSHTNTNAAATAEAAGGGGGGSSATLTRPTSSSSSARPDLWDPDLDSPRGTNNNNSGETLLPSPSSVCYAFRYALMSAAAEPGPNPNPNPNPGGVVERILLDSADSEQLLRIMRTLTFRLESYAEALGSGRPGGAGAGGLRALSLLLGGAEAVLTCSLDLIPLVARILRACERSSSSSSSPNFLLPGDGTGTGTGQQEGANAIQNAKKVDRGQVRVLAGSVMSLLLDHHDLTLQRQQRQQRVQEFRFDLHSPRPTLPLNPRSHSRSHSMTSLHSKRQVRATTRGGPLPSFAALHSQVGLGSHEARLPTVRLSGRQPGPDRSSVPARERADPPAGREGDLLLLDDLTEPPAVVMSEADKYRVLNQDTGQATLPCYTLPYLHRL